MSTPILVAGAETLVTTTTAGDQYLVNVASLTDGGWIAVWMSPNSIDGLFDIFTQRFSAAGDKIGGEVLVNTQTAGEQWWPSIEGLSDGGWVVGWMGPGDAQDVYFQKYDANGGAVGGQTQVVASAGVYDEYPEMARLGDGGFAFAWMTADGYLDGVFVQLFDALGAPVGAPILANTTTAYYQGWHKITETSNGGFVVAWEHPNLDGLGSRIYSQAFDASGAKVGGETLVVNALTGSVNHLAIAGLQGGGWVVTWTGEDSDFAGVFAQTFDAGGLALGGPVLVNTTTVGVQAMPSIAALADGGYVIVWYAVDAGGWEGDTYSQRFDSAGAKVGGETLVNTTTAGQQSIADIAGLANGGYTVVWFSSDQDGSGAGAYQKAYLPANHAPTAVADQIQVVEDATSANLWTTLLANDTDPDAGDSKAIVSVDTTGLKGSLIFDASTQTLKYVADADAFDLLGIDGAPSSTTDSFTYTMQDAAGVQSTATVIVQVNAVSDGRSVAGTSKDDLINAVFKNGLGSTAGEDQIDGGAGDDTIMGLDGADRLYGGSGKDQIEGGAGHDRLYGDSGDDRLIGGAGADTLTGGAGGDRFVFLALSDSAGPNLDLIADFGQGGDKIDLSALDANTLLSGDQGFSWLGTAAFSNAAGQLRYETVGGTRNLYGDVNGDGTADFQIQLAGTSKLAVGDFVL